ncbi:hypothetical protein EV426DRAFT_684206 [Tirmania nivea]|nr:hypothetical protein EV426DRAFT_684206 [Tirmania nivea]
MKSQYVSMVPSPTSLAVDNSRIPVRRRLMSGLLDEVLKALLFGILLTLFIHHQRNPTKLSTCTQRQTYDPTIENAKISLGGWTEGYTQIPCTSPNHGLKLAPDPSSSGRWNFLMLVDGPLVRNESTQCVVVQIRTWRACYFQEWMLEMNVVQPKEDRQSQAQADAQED